MAMMVEKVQPDVATGIIGLFDILGYKNFLKNNSPESAAEEVLRKITSLKTEVINKLISPMLAKQKTVTPETAASLKKFLECGINWLIFSDTILITCPYLENDTVSAKQLKWALFLGVSVVLLSEMFEFGLPIRGAIGFGNFMTHGNCFVGTPIVEAYECSHDIELAACVLCESARVEIYEKLSSSRDSDNNIEQLIKALMVFYLIPKKENKSEKLFTLNINPFRNRNDIRQIVLESFWKHKKDISPSAYQKAENTEKFFRFLISSGAIGRGGKSS